MTTDTYRAVEQFLFDEAALLDSWQLADWLKLFREDAIYCIPSLDSPEKGPQDSLYLVHDDMTRLGSRVNQFSGRSMWSENPRSRTRRLVSNLRILSQDADEIVLSANFAVFRMRHGRMDTYVGHYEHRIAPVQDGFQFIERKAVLDLEVLNPQGKVSIII
ncbi:aromatic-ring-hydroxylating dioxygenase subunit beta [Actibacterium sp. D379-3]